MTFGKIIKELRRKADMTQEGLAEILNISGQAVSRWENDLAMPDISLLPVLANLFDVTTDYLLGVDITRKEENIQSVLRLATEKGKEGLHKEAADIIRTALSEYPNNYRMMYGLLFHVNFYASALTEQKERRACFEEATAIGEKILDGCTDDELRNQTIGCLCDCYTALGMKDKMKKLAATVPGIWNSREFLLALNTRGKEQLTAKREQVCRLLSAAAIKLAQLHFNHETGRTWEDMTPDDVMNNQKNALNIIDMLCPDGDYGTLQITRLHAYHTMADICFDAGNIDKGVVYLEQVVSLADFLDTAYDGKKTHTSPLFCGQVYGDIIPNIPISYAQNELKLLHTQSYFDKVAATEKGRALLSQLGKDMLL